MLRNVLDDYLKQVGEREFDLPFLALLPELGFYDIHYTHGQAEFGKDFIAKRTDNGVKVQYSFQSKAGDIGQNEFRRDILGQLYESVLLGLGHPSFDRNLPHQTILVTTGRLVGNAPLELQELNRRITELHDRRAVSLWDHPVLLDSLLEKGVVAVHAVAARELESYGRFHVLLGRLMELDISERDIEKHSRHWLDEHSSGSGPLLVAALESEIIAQKCRELGFLYEEFYVRLAALRAILFRLYPLVGTPAADTLLDLFDRAKASTQTAARFYLATLRDQWIANQRDLARLVVGPANMFTYLVHCTRVLEVAGYLYFVSNEQQERQDLLTFVRDFINAEPGCGHIPSDRYASTLVLPVLTLIDAGDLELAHRVLLKVVIWLCDRHEQGLGLARWDAAPYEEIEALLGESFDFVKAPLLPGSFMSCVLLDLAKFLGDRDFYLDVMNDIEAVKLFTQYWQVADTPSQLLIDGPDVITYPNAEHSDDLSEFTTFAYAEHIRSECRNFRLATMLGPMSLLSMTVLLRDRYFPTLWPALIKKDSKLKETVGTAN